MSHVRLTRWRSEGCVERLSIRCHNGPCWYRKFIHPFLKQSVLSFFLSHSSKDYNLDFLNEQHVKFVAYNIVKLSTKQALFYWHLFCNPCKQLFLQLVLVFLFPEARQNSKTNTSQRQKTKAQLVMSSRSQKA